MYRAFGKSSKYGLEKITAKNYDEKIINNVKDAWILAVKDVGKISLERWVEFEFHLRGLFVRVGVIDPQIDGAFLKRKGFLEHNNSYPLARVFPYGGWKVKVTGLKDARTMRDARQLALQSLPDETTNIKAMKELEHFVHSSYQTLPPRFPVLLFTEKRQPSALYKALTLKYSTYFNFGVIRKPSTEFLQQFNIKYLPSVLVMLSKVLPDKKLSFSSIPYDVNAYGQINYLTLSKFLYSIHEKHWKDLTNIKRFKGKMTLRDEYVKDTKEILSLDFEETESRRKFSQVEVQEITHKNYKDVCGDNALGLCLIIFVDGEDEKMKNETFQQLNDAQKILESEVTPVQYLWVNATCHPEYGDVFGIFPDTLPTLLVTKPRQRLFITLSLKDMTPGDISKLVTTTLKGESNLQRYARFNDMLPLDCLTRAENENVKSVNEEL